MSCSVMLCIVELWTWTTRWSICIFPSAIFCLLRRFNSRLWTQYIIFIFIIAWFHVFVMCKHEHDPFFIMSMMSSCSFIQCGLLVCLYDDSYSRSWRAQQEHILKDYWSFLDRNRSNIKPIENVQWHVVVAAATVNEFFF
jgi:hypothetical protein